MNHQKRKKHPPIYLYQHYENFIITARVRYVKLLTKFGLFTFENKRLKIMEQCNYQKITIPVATIHWQHYSSR